MAYFSLPRFMTSICLVRFIDSLTFNPLFQPMICSFIICN